MRKAIILTVSILIMSCSTTKDFSYNLSNSSANKNEVVDFNLYIPELTTQKFYFPQFCIDIEIQGKKYPFIVDTGDRTGSFKFSQNTMNKLQSIKTGNSNKSLSIYGTNSNQEYLISDVHIGDLILNDVSVEVTNDSWFEPFNKYNEDIGIIGWNFLREFNILFDFKNNSLKLYKKGFIPENINITKGMEYTEESKLLYISGTINDDKKKYDLLLDSGAGNFTQTNDGNYILLDIIFDNSFNKAKNISTLNIEGLKKSYISNTLIVDNISIPNMKFGYYKNIPWFLKYKFEGFLGSSFFTNNTLFFDTSNNLLYIVN